MFYHDILNVCQLLYRCSSWSDVSIFPLLTMMFLFDITTVLTVFFYVWYVTTQSKGHQEKRFFNRTGKKSPKYFPMQRRSLRKYSDLTRLTNTHVIDTVNLDTQIFQMGLKSHKWMKFMLNTKSRNGPRAACGDFHSLSSASL